MDIDKATQLAIKVEELKRAKSQLEIFRKTSEFCSILITGEDGNENQYTFKLVRTDKKLINTVRVLLDEMLESEIKSILKNIESF